jgi:hypothetical protein
MQQGMQEQYQQLGNSSTRSAQQHYHQHQQVHGSSATAVCPQQQQGSNKTWLNYPQFQCSAAAQAVMLSEHECQTPSFNSTIREPQLLHGQYDLWGGRGGENTRQDGKELEQRGTPPLGPEKNKTDNEENTLRNEIEMVWKKKKKG